MKVECSQFCCGTVLIKENELSQEYTFLFAKKLLLLETNFSTVERECLEVLLALKNFEVYIFDVHVTIIRNHNCLKWLLTMSPHNLILIRWALCLQRYNIVDIKFKPGVMQTLTNCHAIFLNNCKHANMLNVLTLQEQLH